MVVHKYIMESGLFDSANFYILLTVVVLDFLIGTFRAILDGDLNSSTGLRGLIKHTTVILIATTIGIIFRNSGMTEFSVMLGYFYIAEYALSIIETLSIIGVPFPDWIMNVIDIAEKKGRGKNKDE